MLILLLIVSLAFLTYYIYNKHSNSHNNNKDKESLSAFQISGEHVSNDVHNWHFFTVSKMIDTTMLQDVFSTHRNGYTKDDSRMTKIFCEI